MQTGDSGASSGGGLGDGSGDGAEVYKRHRKINDGNAKEVRQRGFDLIREGQALLKVTNLETCSTCYDVTSGIHVDSVVSGAEMRHITQLSMMHNFADAACEMHHLRGIWEGEKEGSGEHLAEVENEGRGEELADNVRGVSKRKSRFDIEAFLKMSLKDWHDNVGSHTVGHAVKMNSAEKVRDELIKYWKCGHQLAPYVVKCLKIVAETDQFPSVVEPTDEHKDLLPICWKTGRKKNKTMHREGKKVTVKSHVDAPQMIRRIIYGEDDMRMSEAATERGLVLIEQNAERQLLTVADTALAPVNSD